MKYLDRIDLIDRVARKLQSIMTYTEITNFLTVFGVDTKKETTDNGGSKWVFVKELLATEHDNLILKIADELDIEHEYSSSSRITSSDSRFWQTNYFRLFISHLSEHKVKQSQLKKVLKEYGISAFVAHADIEPTKEWMNEIETALFSMDALVAVLTPGFDKSKWTDQEVGVAIGRDILIIPIQKGMDPYGFIGRYQGLQGDGKTIGQVAKALYEILANHSKTKDLMANALVNQVVLSNEPSEAMKKLDLLRSVEALPIKHLEKIRDESKSNITLMESSEFVNQLNKVLTERNLDKVVPERTFDVMFDDDIPF